VLWNKLGLPWFLALGVGVGCAASADDATTSGVGGASGVATSASTGAGTGGTIATTSGGGGSISGPFILKGHVVGPKGTFDGEVLVDGALLGCVAPGTECEQTNPGLPVLETGGVIAPGLIDTHNHILFDIFDNDDWVPHLPKTCSTTADCAASPYCKSGACACTPLGCKYTDHDRWPKEAEYGLMLDYKQCLEDASQGKPIWCPATFEGTSGSKKCEMNKWGSMKGLIAGTTSIVGLPGQSSACFHGLARSVDVEQNGLDEDKVQTSALFPPSKSSADGVCANLASGKTDAYLIHVGEGVNATALAEFTELRELTTTPGCLFVPGTVVTHGTAFGKPEFEQMAAAGMKLTWSPASNVALYGTTTDIPTALAAGVLVSLAPDWSMGGSPNLLEELRFARAWSEKHWGGVLTDEQLVAMVTRNAAEVLGLSDAMGRLEKGMLADVAVFAGSGADPFGAIVAATPATVRLVLVGGVALYGDAALAAVAPTSPGCDALDVCGASKFLCAADGSGNPKAEQTFKAVKDALEGSLATLDGIDALPLSACGGSCPKGEACYARTSKPVVAASNCGGSCPSGEQCFQVAMSGSKPYDCLPTNDCAPEKNQAFAPLTPLFTCQ